MIHYHGLPITPGVAAVQAISGGHAFVSHKYKDQLSLAIECAQSFALDNGAFSSWKNGTPITNWQPYYEWVADVMNYPGFDFSVIPDDIDGNEDTNDILLNEWPHKNCGAPVWHMHESLTRLKRLCDEWRTVCLGSSREFSKVGSKSWWDRMSEAMDAITDSNGLPPCKLHGLRMLNPKIFTKLPLSSADSTNIGRNIGIDCHWKGTYTPPDKASRALILRKRIESFNSAPSWKKELL